jgi:hypothetical protein
MFFTSEAHLPLGRGQTLPDLPGSDQPQPQQHDRRQMRQPHVVRVQQQEQLTGNRKTDQHQPPQQQHQAINNGLPGEMATTGGAEG